MFFSFFLKEFLLSKEKEELVRLSTTHFGAPCVTMVSQVSLIEHDPRPDLILGLSEAYMVF